MQCILKINDISVCVVTHTRLKKIIYILMPEGKKIKGEMGKLKQPMFLFVKNVISFFKYYKKSVGLTFFIHNLPFTKMNMISRPFHISQTFHLKWILKI